MMPTLAPWGALQGVKTRSGFAFLGVRYAAPPLGTLRWKPPQPWRPGNEVYDATAYGPSPPQNPTGETAWRSAFRPRVMDEDCLNLNVWTPGTDDAKRPVLVHIFGGGFETGSASDGLQNGEELAAQGDAVVVRVSFRIGALGFLDLNDTFEVGYGQANRGALDIILALRWVCENIGAFGGDPDNVTLFGLSSGAFTIASLLAMPGATGLFAKAWMQSGSASRVLTRAQGAEFTREFLRAAGIATGDAKALEQLPVPAILAAQQAATLLDVGDRNAPGGRTLGIVEDGASLSNHPMCVIRSGGAREVPLVLGYTKDEVRLWFATGAMRLPLSFEDVRAEVVHFAGEDHGAELFAFYRARFPNITPVVLRELFLTDAVYAMPAIRTADAQTRAGGRAYLYRFDWRHSGEHARLGAAHGFDEAFVWNNTADFPLAANDHAAVTLARNLSEALLRFAHAGEPGWPAFGVGGGQVFGGEGSAQEDIDRGQAWENVEKR